MSMVSGTKSKWKKKYRKGRITTTIIAGWQKDCRIRPWRRTISLKVIILNFSRRNQSWIIKGKRQQLARPKKRNRERILKTSNTKVAGKVQAKSTATKTATTYQTIQATRGKRNRRIKRKVSRRILIKGTKKVTMVISQALKNQEKEKTIEQEIHSKMLVLTSTASQCQMIIIDEDRLMLLIRQLMSKKGVFSR